MRWFWMRYCYVCGEPARRHYGYSVCPEHLVNALRRAQKADWLDGVKPRDGMCECGWPVAKHRSWGGCP